MFDSVHMKSLDHFSTMPRMFIVFRTFDRIWNSAMFTREFAHVEMDTSFGGIQLIFQTDHCCNSNSKNEATTGEGENALQDKDFYTEPHRKFSPLLFGQQSVCIQNISVSSVCCPSVSIVSHSSPTDNPSCINKIIVDSSSTEKCIDTSYYILPVHKCTIVADAHIAASLKHEFIRSKAFRCRLFRKIRKTSGFKNCTPDYDKWTAKEIETWDNYLSIPFMVDVVAVWPWQKIDHAWSDRILSLLNKHVALEESLAWLSTLGGAHSSLGETFIDHAERAGEISLHQLRLARELGNEVIIARCYLYWAWSLLQRDYLSRCKICILNTWGFVQKMKCCDRILINMCRAVWSRLQYKRSLKARVRAQCRSRSEDSGHWDSDGSGCGMKCKRSPSRFPKPESFNGSTIRMQSVKVF